MLILRIPKKYLLEKKCIQLITGLTVIGQVKIENTDIEIKYIKKVFPDLLSQVWHVPLQKLSRGSAGENRQLTEDVAMQQMGKSSSQPELMLPWGPNAAVPLSISFLHSVSSWQELMPEQMWNVWERCMLTDFGRVSVQFELFHTYVTLFAFIVSPITLKAQ